MTDVQVMALLRYHVNYKIQSFRWEPGLPLVVVFWDHGGNYHKVGINAEGTLTIYEV